MPRDDFNEPALPGEMYFYEFIGVVEENYPHAAMVALLEAVEYARLLGPQLARMTELPHGAYELKVHLGWGHQAHVEMERGPEGVLEPVIARCEKE